MISSVTRESARRSTTAERCRACGGTLVRAFEGVVLGDVPVTYFRCEKCRSLMLPEPHWLERAYSTVIVPDPDFGALMRTNFVDRFVHRLEKTGVVPRPYRALDYGSGLGMLVRLIRDREFEAFGYDLYATPRFAEPYCSRTLPEGRFDLVTCIEVIEHTTNPVDVFEVLRSKVKDDGVVVVSTELCDGQADPSKWHYLGIEHGQHITLFSRAGLRTVAVRTGFDWLTSFDFRSTSFLHLFAPKSHRPPAWRLAALALRHRLGEMQFR